MKALFIIQYILLSLAVFRGSSHSPPNRRSRRHLIDCSDYRTCTSCNYYIDSATNSCKFCDGGEYYDSTEEACNPCNGKCTGKCSYQSFCFDCSSGQYFDLDNMECVSTCSSTQITITNSQFHSKPICRGFDYFVDTSSGSYMELGTKQFPYKNIELAFVEILNFHSHSDRNLRVKVMENTDNYVGGILGSSLRSDRRPVVLVNNITSVTVESYSVHSSLSPGTASIYFTNSSSVSADPKTMFNIMNHTQSEIESDITSSSKLIISHSSFTMNRINLFTAFADKQIDTDLFTVTDGKGKVVTLKNLQIKASNIDGSILYNYGQETSLHLENLDIDFYGVQHGIEFHPTCSESLTGTETSVVVTNVTAYNSQERGDRAYSYFYFNGNANITISDSKFEIFKSSTDGIGTIELQTTESCSTGSYPHTVDILNNEFQLNSNPYGYRFNNIDVRYIASSRPEVLNIKHNVFKNILSSILPVVQTNIESECDIFMENNRFVNVSATSEIVFLNTKGTVSIKTTTFSDISEFGGNIFSITSAARVFIDGFKVQNVSQIAKTETAFILAKIASQIDFSLSNLDISDVTINTTPVLNLRGEIGKLEITDSIFSGVIFGSETSMLLVNSLSSLKLQNLTFTNLTEDSSTAIDNFMFTMSTLRLDGSDNSTVQDIVIDNCLVGFMSFNEISETTSAPKQFEMSNVLIQNSVYPHSTNLISLTEIITDQDFQIQINGLVFKELEFQMTGDLILLSCQIKKGIHFNDLVLDDIKGGTIFSSAYKTSDSTPAKFTITNVSITQVDARYMSLITIRDRVELDISDSTIELVTSFGKGSVLNVQGSGSTVSIRNCTLSRNAAFEGGVFNIDANSVLKVYDSTISQNFALQGGVISTAVQGFFEFYRVTIQSNYAVSMPVGVLFDTSSTSILNNCTITENLAISPTSLSLELTSACKLLCFLKSSYKEYISTDQRLASFSPSSYCLQTMQGNILFTNQTVVTKQPELLASFLNSQLTIDSAIFTDITSTMSHISLLESHSIISNVTITNFTIGGSLYEAFLATDLESTSILSNINFINNFGCFLFVLESEMTLDNILIENVTLDNYVLNIDQGFFIFKNSHIRNVTSLKHDSALLYINIHQHHFHGGAQATVVKQIEQHNLTFENIDQTVIKLYATLIIRSDNITFRNSLRAMNIIMNGSASYENSVFENLGSSSLSDGAAFSANFAQIYLKNTTVRNNQAISGGAMNLDCVTDYKCEFNFTDCTFVNNSAQKNGGAIQFGVYAPVSVNTLYANNSAQYGPDIAGYAVKAVLKDSKTDDIIINNVGSGIKITEGFTLQLVDFEGKIMHLDNSSKLVVKISTPNEVIQGADVKIASQGEATFDNLIFTSHPGDQSVEFRIVTTAVNDELVMAQYGEIVQKPLTVNFRYCQPGEYEIGDVCQECSPGSYSFKWNSTVCNSCFDKGNCLGGIEVYLEEGYWRKTLNSTSVTKCLRKKSCKGGFSESNEHPIECDVGYSGLLCAKCIITESRKYEDIGNFRCAPCPNSVLNGIRLAGLLIAVLVFMIILIIFMLKKREESQKAILMKILTNYLQVVTVVLTMKIEYPELFNSLLYPADLIGSPTTPFVSFDCFVKDQELALFAPSPAFFEIFLSGMLPLIFGPCIIVIFTIVYRLPYPWAKEFKRNVVVTLIVILFILHPNLTQNSLSMFECVGVPELESRVAIDLDMECLSGKHLLWIFLVAIPMFFIYGIGIPLTAFILLYRSRDKLNKTEIKRYFLVLYQGLKLKVFYWEFVNTSRKITILIVVVFLAQASVHLKALLITTVLVAFFRLQVFLSPYKLKENNGLERLEMTTGLITLFGGLLFISDDDREPVIDLMVFLFIIVCNINFMINWVFCMLCTFKNVHHVLDSTIICLGFILCKKGSQTEHLHTKARPRTPKRLIRKGGKKVKGRKSTKNKRTVKTRKTGKSFNKERIMRKDQEKQPVPQKITTPKMNKKNVDFENALNNLTVTPNQDGPDIDDVDLDQFSFRILRRVKEKKNRRYKSKKEKQEEDSYSKPPILEVNEDAEYFMSSDRSGAMSGFSERKMGMDSSRPLKKTHLADPSKGDKEGDKNPKSGLKDCTKEAPKLKITKHEFFADISSMNLLLTPVVESNLVPSAMRIPDSSED
ncbi:unnamed protein product [Moneuplotes crassus]|uniref:TNFR-Cys domain-containing protein n=1 Tax=Euplotes crassus TaxID=5936 RepID=A0AAD1X5E4_EUPCR|nr:unnamed protein product [Moneuplotes crassus]